MGVIKAIVYSNVWIALGASAYALHTMMMTHIKLNYSFLLLVFLATLFSYNFQRLIRFNVIENKTSERLIWMDNNKNLIKYLTIFSFSISLFLTFYYLTIEEIFLTIPAFVLVIFYATFFNKRKKGLRDLPLVKIFIISAVWAYVLGIFPLLISGHLVETKLVFIDKFCFILAITIPFDIRDLSFDKEQQKTLPMILGIYGAKAVAIIALGISLYINHWFVDNQLVLITFYALALLLVLLSSRNKSELYFSGMIDGLLVLSPLLFV